ncbi:hypothetical protein ymoll0001_8070 [Yersinia mollaretii ATCC 43969]|uniref:Uncharacterized protein n=1 Tax=Yersinia mollaretii (strain ATCC 43969 / DSM 18520 / CIP 103324 / CNY 7263 / WAIP 204) TaxID=349967 RepID=A0ABP2EHI1_YERMW|nr:hypothetical protein ymoll0001_8070 [Yersinia mollaretii ATCC 43969]
MQRYLLLGAVRPNFVMYDTLPRFHRDMAHNKLGICLKNLAFSAAFAAIFLMTIRWLSSILNK